MLIKKYLKNGISKTKSVAVLSIISSIMFLYTVNASAVVNWEFMTGLAFPYNYNTGDRNFWYIDNEGFLFYGDQTRPIGNSDWFYSEDRNGVKRGDYRESYPALGVQINQSSGDKLQAQYTEDIAVTADNKYLLGLYKDGHIIVVDLEKNKGIRRIYKNYEAGSKEYEYVPESKKNMMKEFKVDIKDATASAITVNSKGEVLTSTIPNKAEVLTSTTPNKVKTDKLYRVIKVKDIDNFMKEESETSENPPKLIDVDVPNISDLNPKAEGVGDITNIKYNGASNTLLIALLNGSNTELYVYNKEKNIGPKMIGQVEKRINGMTVVNKKIKVATDDGIYELKNLFIADRVRKLSNIKDKAIMASGEIYPDALSISSLATKENIPILISKKAQLPSFTSKFIEENKIKSLVFAGGLEAVNAEVEKMTTALGAKTLVRYAGQDRYETSRIIADSVRKDAKYSLYASGQVFADELIAGVIGGDLEAPILLVKKDEVPNSIKEYLTLNKNKRIIVGGYDTISKKIENEIMK